MPMVLRDEESCIKAALTMCGRGPDEAKRVRIHATDLSAEREASRSLREYQHGLRPLTALLRVADGLDRTVAWYRENEDWWAPILSGSYREYDERHYRTRLSG